MKIFNNNGEVLGEMNAIFTQEGYIVRTKRDPQQWMSHRSKRDVS